MPENQLLYVFLNRRDRLDDASLTAFEAYRNDTLEDEEQGALLAELALVFFKDFLRLSPVGDSSRDYFKEGWFPHSPAPICLTTVLQFINEFIAELPELNQLEFWSWLESAESEVFKLLEARERAKEAVLFASFARNSFELVKLEVVIDSFVAHYHLCYGDKLLTGDELALTCLANLCRELCLARNVMDSTNRAKYFLRGLLGNLLPDVLEGENYLRALQLARVCEFDHDSGMKVAFPSWKLNTGYARLDCFVSAFSVDEGSMSFQEAWREIGVFLGQHDAFFDSHEEHSKLRTYFALRFCFNTIWRCGTLKAAVASADSDTIRIIQRDPRISDLLAAYDSGGLPTIDKNAALEYQHQFFIALVLRTTQNCYLPT